MSLSLFVFQIITTLINLDIEDKSLVKATGQIFLENQVSCYKLLLALFTFTVYELFNI